MRMSAANRFFSRLFQFGNSIFGNVEGNWEHMGTDWNIRYTGYNCITVPCAMMALLVVATEGW